MPLKSKLEIIEEIAAYYSEDPSRRGVRDDGLCQYYTEGGKICAVGYCLKNPEQFKELEGTIDSLWEEEILLNDFKGEYQINDEDFWTNLQGFHDLKTNWETYGLTDSGLEELEKLRKFYAETPIT